MSTEIRGFYTEASQRETNESVKVELPSGTIVVRFILLKRTGRRRFDALGGITYDDPPTVLVRESLIFYASNFLSNRGACTKFLNELVSSSMPDVPDHEHPDIIEKTFKIVEEGAVLGFPIDIVVVDTTVRLLGCATSVEEYHMNVDRDTRELMELCKCVVATKVSIDGLEKVTLDSLDLTAKQTTCILCREGLNQIDVVDKMIDHPPTITRLPCSHMYHGDYIEEWLRMSQLCPLSRYALPIVRVACELPISEVMDQGPAVGVNDEPPISEVPGQRIIVEVTDYQPIVEEAHDYEQPIFEVADEPPKPPREVECSIEGPG